ncbi:MAG: SurA N-terminal domain-containing protein [Clostridia bacterium]|nr:SurA N-terminal domain-containing protein [Clostridia bacterium]
MASQNNRPQPKKTGMSKKKKIITIVVAAVLAVALIAGIVAAVVLSNWEEYKQYAADRKTVAICNGFEMPYEELYFVTMFYKDSLADTYGEGIWDDPATAEQYRAELEALVAENLSQNYVVLSACRNLGIKTEGADIDKYVDSEMKKLREAFDSQKEYEAWLAEHWMTEHYMRFSIGVSYLESALYYTLLDNGMLRYTLENAADFRDYVENSGDYVRTIHVFIENVEGEEPAANLAEAKKISDALRAVEDPQQRRELMSEYIGSKVNDDLLAVTGDGYYFTRGEMDLAYEEASFGLAMGEVSEPVVCSGGNFVIMRLYPDAEYIKKNVEDLLDSYHGVAVGLYEDQFREECEIFWNEYGESIDILTLK